MERKTGFIPRWNRRSSQGRFLQRWNEEERFLDCCTTGWRVSDIIRLHRTCLTTVLAKRHVHYRPFLIDHLFDITLRHWEFGMRVLGAQSLRVISELDLAKLGPENAIRAV